MLLYPSKGQLVSESPFWYHRFQTKKQRNFHIIICFNLTQAFSWLSYAMRGGCCCQVETWGCKEVAYICRQPSPVLSCLQRTLQFARDGFLSVFLPPTYPTHIWAYIQMTQVIAYEYLHQLQYTLIYIHVYQRVSI